MLGKGWEGSVSLSFFDGLGGWLGRVGSVLHGRGFENVGNGSGMVVEGRKGEVDDGLHMTVCTWRSTPWRWANRQRRYTAAACATIV